MSNVLNQIDIEQNQSFGSTFVVDFIPLDGTTHQQIASPGVIIVYVFLLLLVESLGNFLLFCIILYEKYGMDPQKRTVTNQLLSRMIVVLILCNIFILPFFTIVEIFGPNSKLTMGSSFCNLVWAVCSHFKKVHNFHACSGMYQVYCSSFR